MIKFLAALALLALPLSALAQSALWQGGTGRSTSVSGDLLFGASSTIRYNVLPIGANGNVLWVNNGLPAWAATSSLGLASTTGSTSSVAYFGTDRRLTSSSTFSFTAAGNLGIGTTTPAFRLDAVSPLTGAVVDNVGRFSSAADYVAFTVNATKSGGTGQTNVIFQKNGSQSWSFGSDFAANGTRDFFIYDANSLRNPLYITSGGDVRLGGTSGFSGTQAMTVLQSGNVGIGSTTPNTLLTVQGNINLGTSTANYRLNGTRILSASSSNLMVGNAGNLTLSGTSNTLVGNSAGAALTNGTNNVLLGVNAGQSLTSGTNNVAIAVNAMSSTQNGGGNLAIGINALRLNVSGSNNACIGLSACDAYLGSTMLGIGFQAGTLATGAGNAFIGNSAGAAITTGTNNFFIGNNTVGTSSATSFMLNIGNRLYGNLRNTAMGVGTTTPHGTFAIAGSSSYPSLPLLNIASSSGSVFFAVNPDGNVGIGTTTPGRLLAVNGDALINGSIYLGPSGSSTIYSGSAAAYRSIDITTGGWTFTNSASQGIINVRGQGTVRYFDNDNSNYAGISSAVAVTSNYDMRLPAAMGTTGQALGLTGSSQLGWLNLVDVSGSSLANTIAYYSDDNTITGDTNFTWDGTTFAVGTAGSGNINLNDPVYAPYTLDATLPDAVLCLESGLIVKDTSFSGCNLSSMKYKHGIETVTAGGISGIMKLRPASFVKNNSGSARQVGFIAEEVSEAFPMLTVHEKDGSVRNYDDRGLAAMIVKAVQEIVTDLAGQKAKISELEARLQALESKNNE